MQTSNALSSHTPTQQGHDYTKADSYDLAGGAVPITRRVAFPLASSRRSERRTRRLGQLCRLSTYATHIVTLAKCQCSCTLAVVEDFACWSKCTAVEWRLRISGLGLSAAARAGPGGSALRQPHAILSGLLGDLHAGALHSTCLRDLLQCSCQPNVLGTPSHATCGSDPSELSPVGAAAGRLICHGLRRRGIPAPVVSPP